MIQQSHFWKMGSKRHLDSYIYYSTIHNRQEIENNQCPSTDGKWIKKMQYTLWNTIQL
jgi:hypothetical protein